MFNTAPVIDQEQQALANVTNGAMVLSGQQNWHKGEWTNLAIYVFCHYDFSQLEYVAPFFERHHGSKVFLYKWNGMYDKMKHHYLQQEYKDYDLQVYDFHLQTIIHSIANEPAGRKVVFLLTASTAYAFGQYQIEMLKSVKDAFPDRVWGTSIVGHCMYGCMSCSGVEHKVPVYFSRYYRHQLTYTAPTIRKQYSPDLKQSQRFILVAPSTGTTSLLMNREMLEYLHSLELEGRYKFLFKLHPMCFNLVSYDLNDAANKIEYDNVNYVFKTFAVTSQEQPCLLPFIETCDSLLCDLHSSVGFIASYFSPRRIFAYHNDTGYDVPDRDPEFLANFYVFDDFNGMKQLFDTFPGVKGSNKFFKETYGAVDGNEVDIFGKRAGWPVAAFDKTKAKPDIIKNWRSALTSIAGNWTEILKSAKARKDLNPTDDEDYVEECLSALGMNLKFTFPDEISPVAAHLTLSNSKTDNPSGETLHVSAFNLWHGGFAHPELGNVGIQKLGAVILQSKSKIFGLQECAGQLDPITNQRVGMLPQLIAELKKQSGNQNWTAIEQGILTPGKGNITPWGIVTCLKVVQQSKFSFGVQAETETGKRFWFFNTHLPYFPYEPYQLVGIPYEDQPFLDKSQDAVDSAKKTRLQQLQKLLDDIKASTNAATETIIVTGDWNEPSCLDWTTEAAVAGYHPFAVDWPATRTMLNSGFFDAYRLCNVDPVLKPAFTWAPRKAITELKQRVIEEPYREHHDRIDFAFINNESAAKVIEAEIVGCSEVIECDESLAGKSTVYPTDHQMVRLTLNL